MRTRWIFALLVLVLVVGACKKRSSPTAPTTSSEAATSTPTWTETPLFTATPTWTFTPSSTLTETSTGTASPTESFTPTFTSTPTATPTDTPTESFTPTPTDTWTATQTATWSESFTPTSTATESATASNTPSATETSTSTPTGTFTSTTSSTHTPTETLSPTWTSSPTVTCTFTVTSTPTITPTPTSTFCSFFGGSEAGYPGTYGPPHTRACIYSLDKTVTVSQMSVLITSCEAGQRLNVAIFNDLGGTPGSMIVQGTPQAMSVGWNEVPVPDTLLASGNYWLAVKFSGGIIGIKGDENLKGDIYYILNDAWNNGDFLNPYATTYVYTNGNKLSIRAVFCVDPTFTPTATPTDTASPTETPTDSPTWTSSPTATSTSTLTFTATSTPTDTPLAMPTLSCGPAVAYVSDGNTVLLDHLDGSTVGSLKGLTVDGSACGSTYPTATPVFGYFTGVDGLDRYLKLKEPNPTPGISSSYLEYPTVDILSQANGTLEMWVYPTQYSVGLATQGQQPHACSGWTFGMSIDATGHLTASAWAAFSLTSSTTMVLDRWSHIAVTWGSAGAKMYVNGELVGTDTNTGRPASGYSGRLRVSMGTGSGVSAGVVDEIRVSNVQRTVFNTGICTLTPTYTATIAATSTSTPTGTPTATFTLTWTGTPTHTSTQTLTSTLTSTSTQTATPTPSATSTSTGTPTFTPTQTAYCSVPTPFGVTSGSVYSSYGNDDRILAAQCTVPSAGYITGLGLYAASSGGYLRLALYNSSRQLVVQTDEITTAVAGWNTFRIPNTYVAAGTYWLTAQAKFNWRGTISSGGALYYQNHTYGAFPSNITLTYMSGENLMEFGNLCLP